MLSRADIGTLVVAAVAVGAGCGSRTPVAAPVVPGISQLPYEVPRPASLPPPPPTELEQLDHLLERQWAAAGVTPAPPADAHEFIRRVTLDLLGRIPTVAEIEDYLQPHKPSVGGRNARLVDELLDSPEHAEAWADVYMDLFVGRQFRKPGVTKKLDPRSYFVDAIRENRRFDQMAIEMLTFTGDMEPSGPGVFLASHLKGGGPEAAAAATARLFLGVQIQCAQCHDHPYDPRYKQDDFYGLVAYFSRTKSRERKVDVAPEAAPATMVAATMGAPAKPDKPERVYSIVDQKRGQATFRRPGSTEDVVASARFLGHDVRPLPGETPRQTLARAVVQSDLFAKTVVDRTWARLFGSGLVEPWDDLGGENDAHHPEVLTRLAEDFRRGGFDMRDLLRTLVLSRAYGLTSRTEAAPAAHPDAAARFSHAAVRRETPDQIFRSLLVATGADRMERPGNEPMDKKIERLMREYLFVFGDDEQAEIETFDGNIPQALLMWNGEIVNMGARARPGGVLAGILADGRDPGGRLERMFLATLSRPPSDAERARLLPMLEATTAAHAGTAAYEDVFFALLTSTEMLTIH